MFFYTICYALFESLRYFESHCCFKLKRKAEHQHPYSDATFVYHIIYLVLHPAPTSLAAKSHTTEGFELTFDIVTDATSCSATVTSRYNSTDTVTLNASAPVQVWIECIMCWCRLFGSFYFRGNCAIRFPVKCVTSASEIVTMPCGIDLVTDTQKRNPTSQGKKPFTLEHTNSRRIVHLFKNIVRLLY